MGLEPTTFCMASGSPVAPVRVPSRLVEPKRVTPRRCSGQLDSGGFGAIPGGLGTGTLVVPIRSRGRRSADRRADSHRVQRLVRARQGGARACETWRDIRGDGGCPRTQPEPNVRRPTSCGVVGAPCARDRWHVNSRSAMARARLANAADFCLAADRTPRRPDSPESARPNFATPHGATLAWAKLVVEERFGAAAGEAESPHDGRVRRGLCPVS
jgi:hypothetical protein